MSPKEEKTATTPKPRCRWKCWVLGLCVVGAIFLGWANGPGLRWALKKVILQQLEAQKLTGTFEIKGSALFGVAIHNLSLTGESKIQRVESNLLQIDWSISSLLDKKLEGLTLDKLHLVIDLEAPELPAKAAGGSLEEQKPKALNDTLDLVRGIIQPTQITLTDLRLEVIDTKTITLQSLTHVPESTTYIISDIKTTDHLDRLIANPKSNLTWDAHGFAIDQVTLLPKLALRDLTFHPGKSASGDLFIDGNKIALSSDLGKEHRLLLESSALPIATLLDLAKLDLEASGIITALEIDTAKGLVNFKARDLQYQEQKIASATIEASTPELLSPFDQAVEIKVAIDDRLTLDGEVTPSKEILDSSANLAFTLNWPDVPSVRGELVYHSREARVIANALEGLRVTARYLIDSQTYQAEALATLKDAATLEKHLAGPLEFIAKAKGNLKEATHTGTLTLAQLKFRQPDLPEANTAGVISWDWPKSVTVQELKMTSPEGQLKARLAWQDDTLKISQLDLSDDTDKLLEVTGSLPAPLKTKSLDDLLEITQPISLSVKSQLLDFEKLSSFAPIPQDLSGKVIADITLSGTIANPTLNGFAKLKGFLIKNQPDLPPVDLDLNFETENQKLLLTASAREPGGPLLEVTGNLPFLPRAWIERKEKPDNSPIQFALFSPDLDLKRVKPFAPIIRSIDGTLKLNVQVAGTISAPDLSGSASARIKRMRLAKSPISDFRDSSFSASFVGKKVIINPSKIEASGGTANVQGTIDLAGKEPLFDINLDGKYFLLTRSADYTFRANPDLRFYGPLSQATLSGTLQLVESLFYKDVEILPFGIPRSTDIPRPNLPSFSQKPAPKSATPSTPGIMDCKLNIDVTTRDPILIRGNLAKGEISGKVKVTGTIRAPKTSGTLNSKGLTADLPFSKLSVETGIVTLRQNALTNPYINLRGSSQIGQYNVQIYLTGAVQDPKLVLTSDPPLPESEIMLLLATGSASAQLEDQQVASQKALQYLLEGLRRKNGDKDKTLLQRFLKNSDQIELSLGDTNQYSGRKFSSATLAINDQWDFTTQIDDQGQTRALVVFSVRLR